MQPHQPPRSQPSFLEREIIGIPIFIHIAATAVSCGIWLLVLLIAVPVEAVKSRLDFRDRLSDAIFNALTWPIRYVYNRFLK